MIRIEVSQLPPPEYSPNWRGHWAQRYQAETVYGNAVYYSSVDARNRASLWQPFTKARLDLTFVFPYRRVRDEDNLRARFKPGQDALVQAGLLVGDSPDSLTMGKVTVEVDRKRAPLTIIELEDVS